MSAEWNSCQVKPDDGVIVELMCDDFSGDYVIIGAWKNYKVPANNKNKKGFRIGGRWVDQNGVRLTRKETPSAWREIS